MGLFTFHLHLPWFTQCERGNILHTSKAVEFVQDRFEGGSIPRAPTPTLLSNAPNFHHLRRNFVWNTRANSFADLDWHLPLHFDLFEGDPSRENLCHINEPGKEPRPIP